MAKQQFSDIRFQLRKSNSQAGVATLGLGAILRYTNVSHNVPQDYSNTFIGGQANFNFNQIGVGKFVPFVGVSFRSLFFKC